jgi:hypothetical protein
MMILRKPVRSEQNKTARREGRLFVWTYRYVSAYTCIHCSIIQAKGTQPSREK